MRIELNLRRAIGRGSLTPKGLSTPAKSSSTGLIRGRRPGRSARKKSCDNIGIIIVRITAKSSDQNKTQSLTPGTSQIYVTLESSTNLVDWVDATNAVYRSPDTARFFRIRTKALASQ